MNPTPSLQPTNPIKQCIACGGTGHTYLECPKHSFFGTMAGALGVPDILGGAPSPTPQPTDITKLRELFSVSLKGGARVYGQSKLVWYGPDKGLMTASFDNKEEADLYVALRNDAPALLDELERLRDRNAKLLALVEDVGELLDILTSVPEKYWLSLDSDPHPPSSASVAIERIEEAITELKGAE